jgi:hypothetical protein
MATATQEREITDQPTENETPEITLPPTPEAFVVFVFQDDGEKRLEPVALSNWRDTSIVRRLNQEIKEFHEEEVELDRKIQQPKKKKHGGRRVSGSELRRSRESREKEIRSLETRIQSKERIIARIKRELKEQLPVSNPLKPMRLVFEGEIKTEGEPLSPEEQEGEFVWNEGEIRVEGEPLSLKKQEWWKFVWYQMPEAWDLLRNGRKNDFDLLNDLFRRKQLEREAEKYAVNRDRRTSAERKIKDILEVFKGMSDAEFDSRFGSTVVKITAYFEQSKQI